jgi:hypothetical protein
MGNDSNPYAAPRTDVNAAAGVAGASERPYWRSGPLLVVRSGASLPPRCVKCNGLVLEPLKRSRFYWHHQAWFVLILFNIILYAVVALFVRKHADVSFGLCAEHKARRRAALLRGLAGIGVSIALVVIAVMLGEASLVPITLLVFLGSIVYMVVKARSLLPVRIDRFAAQFKGCGEDFLASLPSR